jgi:hypothetical protein
MLGFRRPPAQGLIRSPCLGVGQRSLSRWGLRLVFKDSNVIFFISFREKLSKESAIADILCQGLFFIYFLPLGLSQPHMKT